MNDEEKQYLPYLTAALRARDYPADAIVLIVESPFAARVVGEAWRNHLPRELATDWFLRRWLVGPNRCYWLWLPGAQMENIPPDVARRAEHAMKRRRLAESQESSFLLDSGFARGSGYRPPSR